MVLTKWTAILFLLLIGLSCTKKNNKGLNSSNIKVSESNLAFTNDKLFSIPGGEISFKLFNGLKSEGLKFYLLKKGEDPILVQHLKVQKGEVPREYFIYQSDEILPNTEKEVKFNAPKEEGTYAFVGVADMPRKTLIGTLTVRKESVTAKEPEKVVVQ